MKFSSYIISHMFVPYKYLKRKAFRICTTLLRYIFHVDIHYFLITSSCVDRLHTHTQFQSHGVMYTFPHGHANILWIYGLCLTLSWKSIVVQPSCIQFSLQTKFFFSFLAPCVAFNFLLFFSIFYLNNEFKQRIRYTLIYP